MSICKQHYSNGSRLTYSPKLLGEVSCFGKLVRDISGYALAAHILHEGVDGVSALEVPADGARVQLGLAQHPSHIRL